MYSSCYLYELTSLSLARATNCFLPGLEPFDICGVATYAGLWRTRPPHSEPFQPRLNLAPRTRPRGVACSSTSLTVRWPAGAVPPTTPEEALSIMTSTDKKAKARERMAATGENYTTALRAIDKALAFTRELSFLDMLAHLDVSDPETDPHRRDTEISRDELASCRPTSRSTQATPVWSA